MNICPQCFLEDDVYREAKYNALFKEELINVSIGKSEQIKVREEYCDKHFKFAGEDQPATTAIICPRCWMDDSKYRDGLKEIIARSLVDWLPYPERTVLKGQHCAMHANKDHKIAELLKGITNALMQLCYVNFKLTSNYEPDEKVLTVDIQANVLDAAFTRLERAVTDALLNIDTVNYEDYGFMEYIDGSHNRWLKVTVEF